MYSEILEKDSMKFKKKKVSLINKERKKLSISRKKCNFASRNNKRNTDDRTI